MSQPKVYKKLVLCGGLFVGTSKPGRRMDDNYFDTTIKKLKLVLKESSKSTLFVFAGPLLRRRFDVKALSHLVRLLRHVNCVIIPDEQCLAANGRVDEHSTVGLLHASGAVMLPGDEDHFLRYQGEDVKICYDAPMLEGDFGAVEARHILISAALSERVTSLRLNSTIIAAAPEFAGGIVGDKPLIMLPQIVRQIPEVESEKPRYYRISSEIEEVPVEHQEFIFEHRAIVGESESSPDKHFVELLEASLEQEDEDVRLEAVLDRIMKEKSTPPRAWEILDQLKNETAL